MKAPVVPPKIILIAAFIISAAMISSPVELTTQYRVVEQVVREWRDNAWADSQRLGQLIYKHPDEFFQKIITDSSSGLLTEIFYFEGFTFTER